MSTIENPAPLNQSFGDKLQAARNSKWVRLVVMLILLVVLWILYFTSTKMKWLILWLIFVLLAAIWIQVFDYDIDLGTMMRTWGNIAASRVEYKSGVKILGSDCPINNLNCSDFTTQPQAQAKYEMCAAKIAQDNEWKSAWDIKNLDIYWLDKNKNGVVCESLPWTIRVATGS